MQIIGLAMSILILYLLVRAYVNHRDRIKEVRNVSIDHFDFEYVLETDVCTIMSSTKGVVFDVRGFNIQLWDGFDEYRQGISLFDKNYCINFFFRKSALNNCLSAEEALKLLESKKLIIR